MISLRLAKEYMAEPIFCYDVKNMGHISLDDLPISEELKAEISDWDKEYQATFNKEYPPDSGFKNSELETKHIEKGAELAQKLQIELSDGYSIDYQE